MLARRIQHYFSFLILFIPIPILLLKIFTLPFKFFWGIQTLYILLLIYFISVVAYVYFFYHCIVLAGILFSIVFLRLPMTVYKICYYFYKFFNSYFNTFFIMFLWWSFIYIFYVYKQTLISLGEEVPILLFLAYYSLYVIGYKVFIILRFLKDEHFFFDAKQLHYLLQGRSCSFTLLGINGSLFRIFCSVNEKKFPEVFKKLTIYYIFELYVQYKSIMDLIIEERRATENDKWPINKLINMYNEDWFFKNDPLFLKEKILKEKNSVEFEMPRFYKFSVRKLSEYRKAQNYRLISTILFSLSLILFLYN
jgi:hypothetical protein